MKLFTFVKWIIIILIFALLVVNLYYFYTFYSKDINESEITKEQFEEIQVNIFKNKVNFNHTYFINSEGKIIFYDSANAKYQDQG